MFQYASLRGIAAKHKYDWCVPPPDTYKQANYGLFDCFKMSGAEGHVGYVPQNFKTVDESTFAFDEEQFDSFPDNVNVDGYRQTEKYFKHIENKIRKDFAFLPEIMKPCRKFMKQFAGGRVVFLHVRRGDNVGRPDFYPMPRVEYYKRVLDKHFPTEECLVISDDPEWCKNEPFFDQDRFFVSESVDYYDHQTLEGDGSMKQSAIPYVDLCLKNDDVVVDSLGNRLYTELFNPFNINVKTGMLNGEYVQEPHFQFSEDLFNNCPDNVSLIGYYQTPKYFNHITDEIRKDFTFRPEILDPCKDMMEEMTEPVALHIRRGDFITNVENHYNQGLDYYEEALKKFEKHRQVIIFSDDTEWCNEQELFKPDRSS